MSSRDLPSNVLAPVPAEARFITWALASGADAAEARARVAGLALDEHTLVGLGLPLAKAVAGLRAFPGDMPLFPPRQGALWARLAHERAGQRFDAGAALAPALGPAFVVTEEVDAFVYRGGRDLSGYEDGTENPHGDDARAAAVIASRGPGLDGGSFVAVQRWVHDLAALARFDQKARDNLVGRAQESNEELEDAPASSHVKRTAQESFDPPAFMVRRSMPYGGLREHGLYFVAFVEALDRFERMLRRMAGLEDGVMDALFTFAQAATGGYYFCPPRQPEEGARLDLRALGGA